LNIDVFTRHPHSVFYKASLNTEVFTGDVCDTLDINITNDLAACAKAKFIFPFKKGKGYRTGRKA